MPDGIASASWYRNSNEGISKVKHNLIHINLELIQSFVQIIFKINLKYLYLHKNKMSFQSLKNIKLSLILHGWTHTNEMDIT